MSDLLGDFHFIRPAAWLLAPVAIGLWWLWQRRADPLRGWREQIEPPLLKALLVGPGSSVPATRLPARGALVGWLLAILALAGPTWRLEPSPFADDATPLMLLLETDEHMDRPGSVPARLERARLKIADLAQLRAGQPLGLIAYAGSAHLVLPPTRDTEVVASMAAELGPDVMPVPGNRLDLALREASRVLEEGRAGGSLVVLAGRVDTEPGELRALRKELSVPVQFLSVNEPGSPQDEELRAAAKALGAAVEPMDLEQADVEALVRRAARTPTFQSGEDGGRWQEAGYWLLPLLALLALASFRRDEVAV